jgi:ureidoglycolate hydrolase
VSGHETVRVVQLERDFFSAYGRILEPYAGESPEAREAGSFDFYVPFKEPGKGPRGVGSAAGWRIGYLVCTCRELHQLERHPNTAEVFCPLEGEALLVVAGERFGGGCMRGDGSIRNPSQSAPPPGPVSEKLSSNTAARAPVGFLLDKPIVFNRGVWHGVISLSKQSTMLIVESPDVIDEFRKLDRPLAAP